MGGVKATPLSNEWPKSHSKVKSRATTDNIVITVNRQNVESENTIIILTKVEAVRN